MRITLVEHEHVHTIICMIVYFQQPPRPRYITSCGCRDSRRAWFLVIFSTLLTATCSAVTMSVYARIEHDKYARQLDGESTTTISPAIDGEFQHAMTMALSVTIFSGTICVTFGAIWIVWELLVWPRERELVQEMNRWMHTGVNDSVPLQEMMGATDIRPYHSIDSEEIMESTVWSC